MCGIAGIVNFNGHAVDPAVLRRMTDAIRHRGPDGEGHWFSEEGHVGLGHRRLAIIDLSPAAAQPMKKFDRYVIILNGEIYNYLELREQLKKKGYVFETQSDTEVLITLYAEYHERCPEHLDGMFAFCIYDQLEKILFCARDRFGEKPFYYHYHGRQFSFASEAKALLASGIPFKENLKMVFYFMTYQVSENPFDKKETFFQDIFSLPPGHYLKLDREGKLTIAPYWDLAAVRPLENPDPEEAATTIRDMLVTSVKRRLRSDVPVGSSLSGGIDSSVVVYCIHQMLKEENGGAQSTFTARFDDPSKDEGVYKSMVTEQLDLLGHETWVTMDNFLEDFASILWHQEEPMGGPSPIAQWAVMKLAAANGTTVLLDGQGADEIFAGYMHYFQPFLREKYLEDRNSFKKEKEAYESVHQTAFQDGISFHTEARYPGLLRKSGSVLRKWRTPSYQQDLHPDFLQSFKDQAPPFRTFNDLNQTLLYATKVYGLGKLLKLADRNAMAFAREVRLPFLYHPLVEYVFSLPSVFKLSGGWTKWILRKSFDGLLPDPVIWRKDKIGFEPPMEKWMSNPLAQSGVKEAVDFLVSNHFLKNPHPGKQWFYWNAYNFIHVFKNQINTINHE